MTHPLFEKHRAKLEAALSAIHTRGYWAAYNEMPSPKTYGETAADDGKKAFEAQLGQPFELNQPSTTAWLAPEKSPYGIELGVSYPVCDIEALIAAGQAAGVEGSTGLCIEMLDRLNAQSFEIAHAVIVKPHDNAVLPAAITVRTIRAVLSENGVDTNLVTLCVPDKRETTQALVTHLGVKSVDFTGGNAFGQWLIDHCRQAQVYAELAGVNNIVIDSTDAYQPMLRNLAFTLSLYSGQMCTTSQALFVPAGGIDTEDGHKTYDEVCTDLARALEGFLAKPEVACAVLGAVQSTDTLERIALADSGALGKVLLASKKLDNPEFPKAEVRTPVLLACDAADESAYMQERFGPISFVVCCADTASAIALSERLVGTHGALTVGIYSTRPEVIDAMTAATCRSKVALSINLTGGVFVNQSSAFSDYHGSGGNPAANASYANSAFVANRFCVIQRRYHV